MFLKRSLVLVIGILLFITAFLLKTHLIDARMEAGFKQERIKFGVQGTVLTAAETPQHPMVVAAPATPAPATPSPAAAPVPSADSSSPDGSTPATGTSSDPNMIIGPVPPSNSSPDSTPEPSNASPPPTLDTTPNPDTNSGPMAPPSSTMVYPHGGALPLFLVAAYDASGAASTGTKTSQETNAPASQETATNASPSAVTNQTAAPSTNAASASTNAAPGAAAENAVSPHATSAGGRAIVLGYHQFTAPGVHSSNIYSMSQDVFAEEMKYLHDNGYHVVPLSDVVRFVKHEIGLPPNAVAISIDDGYKSAINYAAPVLKQYGYPWTFFVYPQFITRHESKGAASWPDLLELQSQGVDVECHSMTHPILSSHRQMFTETTAPGSDNVVIKYTRPYHQLSAKEYDDFLTNETDGAKAILEKELGKKILYFAYPYGSYNKAVEAKVIAAGFEAIFTVAGNPVHVTTDIHSIGRYVITAPVEKAFASYLREGALSLAEVDPAPGTTTSDPRPVISAVLGFNGDPKSIETDVVNFGTVHHDFDPTTSTVRLYLPHDLIQPEVIVSIHAKDAQTGQTMVADWHFNYEPAMGAAAPEHQPIPSETLKKSAPAGESAEAPKASTTNLPATPVKSASTTP